MPDYNLMTFKYPITFSQCFILNDPTLVKEVTGPAIV